MYKIYKDKSVIVEGESPLTITGFSPATNVEKGTYQATRVEGDRESERVDIPAFKTLPIKVTGVTVAPKNKTADSGTAGSEQLTATVAPGNATNKAVTYSIAPTTAGLTVNASGKIAWTESVPSGTYTTTVKTADGNKTDTHVLTLKDPVISVTGVEMTPKTMTGEVGKKETRQLTTTVTPENATNKEVTYSVSPATEGITVNASGVLSWTEVVNVGEYTVTVKTTDGNKTATSTIKLSAPEIPDPIDPEE